jgi:hypothetical protein
MGEEFIATDHRDSLTNQAGSKIAESGSKQEGNVEMKVPYIYYLKFNALLPKISVFAVMGKVNQIKNHNGLYVLFINRITRKMSCLF